MVSQNSLPRFPRNKDRNDYHEYILFPFPRSTRTAPSHSSMRLPRPRIQFIPMPFISGTKPGLAKQEDIALRVGLTLSPMNSINETDLQAKNPFTQ